MSKLVCLFVMLFRGRMLVHSKCLLIGLIAFAGLAHGQDARTVPISFLPPPLENATYSLGIYEAKSGKLVRRLQEIAPESAFTVGLNGLMTNWDGKDDEGKAVPPGRYAARGYAVGPMKVEGVKVLDNDWVNDGKTMRLSWVLAVALVPEDNGLAILATVPDNSQTLARYSGAKDEILWQTTAFPFDPVLRSAEFSSFLTVQGDRIWADAQGKEAAFRLSDGGEISSASPPSYSSDALTSSGGKDGTVWKIESGVLCQYSPTGERLRSLAPKAGEPVPVAVAASKNADRLFLLEQNENRSWQRVRGLSWKEAVHEGEKTVSVWETFFERSIHAFVDPGGPENKPPNGVELTLVENPLAPGKATRLKLYANSDLDGSYLEIPGGLHLRQITRNGAVALKLVKAKTGDTLSFFRYDGAAWDEFSIEGATNIMAFDAGEIEMTANGEKTHTAKPVEPLDL